LGAQAPRASASSMTTIKLFFISFLLQNFDGTRTINTNQIFVSDHLL
jgi:hypothetical protein